MNKKVVFIIGSGHCGSTLLAVILGSHPNCFSVGELKGLPNRYRKNVPISMVAQNSLNFWEDHFGDESLQQLASILGEKRLNKYIPLKLEKYIRQLLGKDEIFNPYSYIFSKLQENVIIDSSKSWLWVEKRLKAQEFQTGKVKSYLIHLVRDGRAIVNSYLRKYPNKEIEKLSTDWLIKLNQRKAFFDDFPEERRLEVAYEKLAINPSETIENICKFVGIDYIPDMLQYWKYDHYDISGNGGTYSLIKKYKSQQNSQNDRGSCYDDLGLNIKLDLRWKQEFVAEKLEIFIQIAGEANKVYEWNN